MHRSCRTPNPLRERQKGRSIFFKGHTAAVGLAGPHKCVSCQEVSFPRPARLATPCTNTVLQYPLDPVFAYNDTPTVAGTRDHIVVAIGCFMVLERNALLCFLGDVRFIPRLLFPPRRGFMILPSVHVTPLPSWPSCTNGRQLYLQANKCDRQASMAWAGDQL